MKYLIFIVFYTIMSASFILTAQSLFRTTNIQAAYKNETRSADGSPGKKYWQNRGDYNIRVSFDPDTHLIKGLESISYFNNSPDTLHKLIFHLYPDLYKKAVARISKINDNDLNGGVVIDELKIGGVILDSQQLFHDNTKLIVKTADQITPQSKVQVDIRWHYTLNTGSPIRTGMVDTGSYFIAYFFPRIAVYDDIDGWDDWNYNGVQEFYNDFGDFDVQVTVPVNFMVWATGLCENRADNLNTFILRKIETAMISDTIVHIIDSTIYKEGNLFNNSATGIWRFKAENVPDFAFAASDHYLWDGSSVTVDSVKNRKTLASAVYNKVHKDYFLVATQARQSVFYMSHLYPKIAFPYDQVTVFDGTDQMEYPMMINDNPTSSHKDAVQLTTHEIFHSYFPFYMGINETQYAWMDEGWATIGESVISPLLGEPEDEGIYSKDRYERIAGTDKDVPLMTNTKLYQDDAYFSNSYGKGGLCYWVLQDMLGTDLFLKSVHQYINNWHGKHPVPYDFFFSINNAAGKNLDWFWQKWFFDWVYPDMSIKSVEEQGTVAKILITNKGGLPLPVFLEIEFNNGDKRTIHYGADIWKGGSNEFNITLSHDPPQPIKSITLGNANTPDKFRADNYWRAR